MADDINNFQISIVTDKTDHTHEQLLEKLKDLPSVVFLERADVSDFPGLVWYWEYIIKKTKGDTDIFGMVGDDMIFKNKGWDSLILKFFNGIPDRIGLLHFNEGGSHGPNLCINSFIHKKWVEVLGYYNDIRLKGDYSDNFLFDIANGINRRGYVKDNVIEHLHWAVGGKGEKDNTAERRISVDENVYDGMPSHQVYEIHSKPLVADSIRKLKAYIALQRDG